MSYATFERLPALSTYAQAEAKLHNTKPIRGRSPALYPLGSRRDANKFAIQKNASGDIELLLYGNAAITFHKNTDPTGGHDTNQDTNKTRITISLCYTRWSLADAQFIFEILYRYVSNTYRQKDMLVLETRGENKTKLVLQHNAERRGTEFLLDNHTQTMTPINKEPLMTYHINRAAANTVRTRHGQFYRYVKGMTALRTQIKESPYPTNYRKAIPTYKTIIVTADEVRAAVGEEHILPTATANATHPALRMNPNYLYFIPYENFPRLTIKPPKLTLVREYDPETQQTTREYTSDPYEAWHKRVTAFIELISPPNHDPEQAEKFARAYTLLLLQQRKPFQYGPGVGVMEQSEFDPAQVARTLDEVLFKYYSNEVFELVECKDGVVPTQNYKDWVDRERGVM